MTTIRTKLSSIALTILIVTSLFAGAVSLTGTAAAELSSGSYKEYDPNDHLDPTVGGSGSHSFSGITSNTDQRLVAAEHTNHLEYSFNVTDASEWARFSTGWGGDNATINSLSEFAGLKVKMQDTGLHTFAVTSSDKNGADASKATINTNQTYYVTLHHYDSNSTIHAQVFTDQDRTNSVLDVQRNSGGSDMGYTFAHLGDSDSAPSSDAGSMSGTIQNFNATDTEANPETSVSLTEGDQNLSTYYTGGSMASGESIDISSNKIELTDLGAQSSKYLVGKNESMKDQNTSAYFTVDTPSNPSGATKIHSGFAPENGTLSNLSDFVGVSFTRDENNNGKQNITVETAFSSDSVQTIGTWEANQRYYLTLDLWQSNQTVGVRVFNDSDRTNLYASGQDDASFDADHFYPFLGGDGVDSGSGNWTLSDYTVDFPGGEEITVTGSEISGRVVDQNGNPVEDATITAWGVREVALNESKAASLEEQAQELIDETTNPLPSSWDPDYDLENHYESANGKYLLVHESADFGLQGLGVQQLSSSVDEPTLQADSDQQVVLSLWDPSQEEGFLGGNQIDNSFPGATTSGNLVVEQLGPTGETTDRTVYSTSTIATVGNRFDQHDIPGVRTSLPTGVYVAYPEGARERGYTFVVGSPDELRSAWTSELENEANQLTDRAKRIRDLLNQDHVVRTTAKTDANGSFSVSINSQVVTADVKAMKADGQFLETVQDPTIEDLRRYQTNGYNGTFYLPSPKPKTVNPPAKSVTVTVYRSPEVPFGNMSSFADLQAWLQNQRLNETVSDLKTEYTQRLDEMERQNLERIYSDHRSLVETVPGAKSRYLDRSSFSEIQAAEDLTNEELSRETRHMQLALSDVDQVQPPEVGDDPIEISDGELNAEYPIPAGINPDTVSPEIHWSDGTVEPIGEEYYSVESSGVPGFGGQTLVIDGYPIDESDPAAFDIRIQGGGEDGRLNDRISGTNPAFGGAVPGINAIDFSTLAPGPSETVYVDIQAASDTGYGKLVKAEAWNDDGTQLTASVDSSKDRASFVTDGEGIHQVRLTFQNTQGDQFVVSQRIRAHEQSRSDPATVRAAQSTLGVYAVTGEELASGRIKQSGGTLQIDAIADSSGGPGLLVVKPANAMDGDETTFDIAVLHGSDEQEVSAHVRLRIHLENVEKDSALFWRSEPSTFGEPVTWDGDTRYGRVSWQGEGKAVLQTYSLEDGTADITVVQSPNMLQSGQHRIARTFNGLPFVGGMTIPSGFAIPSGGFVGLGFAGIAVRRRRAA